LQIEDHEQDCYVSLQIDFAAFEPQTNEVIKAHRLRLDSKEMINQLAGLDYDAIRCTYVA
jgi:hypothetical protein